MSRQHLYLGESGEERAVSFLKDNGYKVLLKNYKAGGGEIDIVALDKDTFCFIEVKTRNSDVCGLPCEAVSEVKQRRISKAALAFIKERGLLDRKARFDVVSIVYYEDGPRVDLIKDAFELPSPFTY